MKKLLIDAGNSSIKWALLDDTQLSVMETIGYDNTSPIDSFIMLLEKQLNNKPSVHSIVVVSVLGDSFLKAAKKIAAQFAVPLQIVKSQARLAKISNAYDKPNNLGADRLVVMIAAFDLGKGVPCIVVDSGTATTIDAVDENGQHLGGVILAGLDLCSQGLLKNTQQLASRFNEEKYDIKPTIFSKDTTQAILSGSLLGLAGAIDSICTKMEKEMNKGQTIKKILCGGSAKELQPHLSLTFSLQDDLIMQGLKVISTMKTSEIQ
ncbi:MAG: type III pantothenate kinase [Cocleimonas sp.]